MCQSLRLWIAFKFVSLYRMTQQILDAHSSHFCCELLSNLYLCIGWHSPWAFPGHALWVVNCFQICIFVSDDTARHTHNLCLAELWIAFKFVSLYRMTQRKAAGGTGKVSCELLSNLYLCIGWHSEKTRRKIEELVVNCFQICIFVSDDTAGTLDFARVRQLWIAFKFVSLYRMTQHDILAVHVLHSCELLSNLYLCIGWHSLLATMDLRLRVVNCFQICIFVSDDTAVNGSYHLDVVLWIAFKFVSLYRMTQLAFRK